MLPVVPPGTDPNATFGPAWRAPFVPSDLIFSESSYLGPCDPALVSAMSSLRSGSAWGSPLATQQSPQRSGVTSPSEHRPVIRPASGSYRRLNLEDYDRGVRQRWRGGGAHLFVTCLWLRIPAW